MKNIHIYLIFITCILFVNICHGQVNEEWVRRYNNVYVNDYDQAYSIAVDNSGNVYVTGCSISGFSGDYLTIKYNSFGVTQWIQRYDGPVHGSDGARAIAVDASGNVYVTGSSKGSGLVGDYLTIKYNSSGVQQWIQRYDGPGQNADISYSMALDAAGNVYITGESNGGSSIRDYATIKYSYTGALLWVQRYNGPANTNDVAYSIAVDLSGNAYVTGYTTGTNYQYNYNYTTIKYNPSGGIVWDQTYNYTGDLYDRAYSIAIDGAGNVYVTGSSWGGGTREDYATIKYNSSGSQQWVQRYQGAGGATDEVAYAIDVDGSGNVFVTGDGFVTIKYSPAGVQQWVQNYSGGRANDIDVDNQGNVYVTGQSLGSNFDYATVKWNPSGVQQWFQRYNGPGNGADYGHSLALDSSGFVYVTGESFDSFTNVDFATIKYSQVPLPPNLLLPANGSTVSQPLMLVWTKSQFALNYRVQVASDSLFNNIIINDSTLTDTTKIVTNLPGNVWYYWRVNTKYSSGISPWSVTWKFNPLFVGIKEIGKEIPLEYNLFQNYPNPFNPVTKIRFAIPPVGSSLDHSVQIIIYDIIGREITTLVNKHLIPGTYEVDWDGSNFSSGVYYYKITAGEYTETKKMILLK